MAGRAARLACSSLALLFVMAGAAQLALAQSIAYTVQVVALSDRAAALGIQTDLLRQGFPAYVVRSTSTQGDVFRVRVGAFGDRDAALLYASAMPAVGGGQPVPALAEGIPAGITPLSPALLAEVEETTDALVHEWRGGFILRLGAPDGPAEYLIFDGVAVERHEAYLLAEVDGARLWVRETLLWPPTWRDESEAVRAGFRTSLLGLLSERMGVSVDEIASAEFRPSEDAAPRLIVVEVEAPAEPDGVRLLGLGLPEAGMGEFGPLAYLGVSADELPAPPVAQSVDELLADPPGSVQAEGYVAVPDEDFTLLEASGQTWRAVLGTPLWTDGQHLLASGPAGLLVYGFVPR